MLRTSLDSLIMRKLTLSIAFVLTLLVTAFDLQAQADSPAAAPDQTPAKPRGITVSGPAGVNISGPTTICKGGETILKAEGDYESFEWNTGVQDRFLRVREEGTYEVTVTTKGGCRLTTSVTVRMIPCT